MQPASSPPLLRLPWRRLAVILGVWVIAAGGALLLASALDAPVGEGDRDAAQPAAPGAVADPAQGLAEGLPPLSLILDRALPPAVVALPPIRQAGLLEQRAQRLGTARAYLEFGSVLQTLGDGVGATAAYRSAIRAGGRDTAAETGLALVEAARGGDGPRRAAARLAQLAASNPRDQLVAFNVGWLAIYRQEGAAARAAWTRTVALGPDERLGRVATALLASLAQGSSGRNP